MEVHKATCTMMAIVQSPGKKTLDEGLLQISQRISALIMVYLFQARYWVNGFMHA